MIEEDVLLDIANGVLEKLYDFQAELSFAPDFELHKMQEQRLIVLPVGRKKLFLSRNSYKNTYEINVALIRKCRNQDAVPSLIAQANSIGEDFLGCTIADCTCMDVKWEPLYSVDELRNNGAFVSVICLSFVELK